MTKDKDISEILLSIEDIEAAKMYNMELIEELNKLYKDTKDKTKRVSAASATAKRTLVINCIQQLKLLQYHYMILLRDGVDKNEALFRTNMKIKPLAKILEQVTADHKLIVDIIFDR